MRIVMTCLLAVALLSAACGSGDETDGAEPASTAGEVGSAAEVDEYADDALATTTTTDVESADLSTTEAAVDDAAAPARSANFSLYDFRHCEILITVADDASNEATEVWGTPGVDPCTDDAWYVLDPAAIQAENDASFIEMSGPRYFIVDGTADTGDGIGGTGTAVGGQAMQQQFGDIT